MLRVKYAWVTNGSYLDGAFTKPGNQLHASAMEWVTLIKRRDIIQNLLYAYITSDCISVSWSHQWQNDCRKKVHCLCSTAAREICFKHIYLTTIVKQFYNFTLLLWGITTFHTCISYININICFAFSWKVYSVCSVHFLAFYHVVGYQ